MQVAQTVWKGLRSVKRWSLAHTYLLLSIATPLVIRTIPEILAGPWPLGFDTVWVYAPFVKDVETKGLLFSLSGIANEQAAPLVFFFLGLAASATKADPFAITKAAAPALYGFLGFSLYWFAKRGLQWDSRKSLLLVLVTTLYFVPLRFSWDMYKNTLGLAFLFLALTYLESGQNSREKWLLATFSGLTILSSELTSVVLGSVTGILFLWSKIQKRHWNWHLLVLAGISVVAVLFYLHVLVPRVIPYSPLAPPLPQSIFPYDYVGANEDAYVYPTLFDVYASVLALTAFLLGPILLLAFRGFFPERRLFSMSFALGIGAFSLLFSPFAAIPAWHRWLYMLAFPILILATGGLLTFSRRGRIAILGILVLSAAAFIGPSDGGALPYFTTSYTVRYIPPSLMRTTVLLADSPDVVRVATWLNQRLQPDSILVANIWFTGWAKLYVDTMPVYTFVNPLQVDSASLSGFSHVYAIDWAGGSGEVGPVLLPAGATEIFTSGRISAYELIR